MIIFTSRCLFTSEFLIFKQISSEILNCDIFRETSAFDYCKKCSPEFVNKLLVENLKN